MKYYSTNNSQISVPLEEAVVRGLAPDKGLYMPKEIKTLPAEFFTRIGDCSLQEIACTVAGAFFGEDISKDDLDALTRDTLNFEIPLVPVSDNIYSLELWHGPTLAFKDVGARFMARLLAYFIERKNVAASTLSANGVSTMDAVSSTNGADGDVHVLVATSGDTGSAVANGFLGVKGIHVHVLYPKDKVSLIQEKQFTTLGQNITAIEIDGTFDDCQALVKSAFMDKELNERMKLTSANSINVARFLPQAFYYFQAYARLVAQQALPSGKKIVICVPSGNFGNLTAGLFAKRMGLPISRFIAANNANDVVYKYLQDGNYDPRPSTPTIANAMDVGAPSNFDRILDLYANDHARITADISGTTYNDTQIADTMRAVYADSGYLLDPHGACGYRALQEKLQADEVGVFLETAHPAKFKDTVESIINTPVAIPDKLNSFMQGTKKSIPLSKDFADFKAYLLA